MTTLDRTRSTSEPAQPDRPSADGPVRDRPELWQAGDALPAGSADVEARTAAKLLGALGARLRTAYERGADVGELAAACHQPEAEVRRLLEAAGVDLSRELPPPDHRSTADRGARPGAGPGAAGPVAEYGPGTGARVGAEAVGGQLRRLRRPTPSRRLSRIHPQPGSPENGARAAGPVAEYGPAEASVGSPVQDGTADGTADGTTDGTAAVKAGAPLGVLIGASPAHLEVAAQSSGRPPLRVAATLVRAGRGTSLVVLPSWRAAIVVSVPTELLLAATGLVFEQLAGVRLSVLINPDALHDRELDLHGWKAENRRPRNF
ncbi:hypothetical protein AB0D08_19790 [Kitasatospora sp. NPDC048540]|uniref:hypothetical protein n=1 Tax=Kitasatospora sp. NPDC048540 TaxID=3155634 RepID=UPI0033FF9D44